MQISVTELAPIRESYSRGLYLRAYEAAERLGPLREWANPAARLLAGRLALQLGAPRLGRLLHLTAWRETPTYHEAIYYVARYRLERYGPLDAWRFMRKHSDWADSPPEQRADWSALHGFVAARLRDFDRARRWLDRADGIAPGRAWLCIERAAYLEMSRRPKEALESARRSTELQPWFRPGVQSCAHILTLLGREGEALQLLEEASRRIESSLVVGQLAGMHSEAGHHRDARRAYDRYAELTPLIEPKTAEWLNSRRAATAYLLGDFCGAAEAAGRIDDEFHRAFVGKLKRSEIDRVTLDVPPSADPFTPPTPANLLAMLARFWARELAAPDWGLQPPHDGLPDPRERTWAEENGFAVREFFLDEAGAEELLRRGIPFLVGAADLQPQLAVGFDRIRRTLLLLGPADRSPQESAWEQLIEGEDAPSFIRGLAISPRDRPEYFADLELTDAPLYDRLHEIQAALLRWDRPAAATALDELARDHPEHRLTLLGRCALARFDGHPVPLLDALKELLHKWPDEPAFLLGKLAALRDVGEHDRRREILARLCRRLPVESLYVQHYAQTLLAEGRPADGLEQALRRAIQYRPHAASAYYILANVLWEKRGFDEAVELYRFAACLETDDEQFAEIYFRSARLTDQLADAMLFLRERYTAHGAESASAARALFHALAEQQEMDAAFSALAGTLEERPGDGELLLFAAGMHADYDDFDTAERLLAEAEGKVPEVDRLRELARLRALRVELPEVIALWRAVLEAKPLDLDAHRGLAQALADYHGRDAALEHLRSARDRFPHSYPLNQHLLDWLRGFDAVEAEAVVRHLLTLRPDDAWARRELALHLTARGCLEEAMEELAEAERLAPDHPSYFYTLGHVHHKADRTEEARAAYRAAVRRSIDNELAITELAALARGEAEQREELDFLAEELTRQPLLTDGVLTFRDQAMRLMEPDELLSVFQPLLDEHPDTWQVWSVNVQQLTMMGRTDEALSLAQEATQRFPLLPRLWVDLSEVHRERGEQDAAIDALNRALVASPGWSAAARELAETFEAEGQADEARAVLEQAIARAPFDPVNHGYLAEALWDLDDAEAALGRLRQALMLDPGYEWAWRTYADWADRMDEPDAVIELSREVCRRRPGDPRAWLALARNLIAPQHAGEAVEALARAIALNPKGAEAYDLMAERLAELKRFDEAAAAAMPEALDEEMPMILHGRAAWVAARRGDYAAAIPAMRALVAVEPNYYWGWQQLSEWLNETGRSEQYLEASEHLVELRGESPVALATRGDAKLQNGDRDGGKDDLRQAQTLAPNYAYAGMLLFDACMADGELDDAASALAILQEHTPGPFVSARQAQLSAERGEEEVALAAVAHIANSDSEAPWPLQAAAAACRSADWGPEVDRVLAEALEAPTCHPATALTWSEGDSAVLAGPDERLAIFLRAVERHPGFIQNWDLLGEQYARLGMFDEARAACRPRGDDPPPTILRGRAAWIEAEAGNRPGAIERMIQILEEDPSYFWGRQQLCGWLSAEKRYREALDTSEQLVALDPLNPVPLTQRGEAKLNLGDREGGKADLRQAQAIARDYAFAGMLLFDACLADGDLDEAEAALAIMQEHTPGAFVSAREIQLRARRGDKAAALGELRELIQSDAGAPWPLQAAHAALRSAGWAAEADQALREAVESDGPCHPWSAVTWAEGDGRTGADPETRLTVLRRGAEKNPNFPQGWDALAEELTRQGHFEEARTACRPEALPEQPLILAGRAAWVEAEAGCRNQAVDQMRELLDANPTYAWGWQQLCTWYSSEGDHQAALEASERLIALDLADPSAFAHRGEARLHLGDREGAKEDFARAYRLDPGYGFAGLHLCDEQLEDRDFAGVEETLTRLRENVGGSLVEFRAVRLGILRDEKEEALDGFQALATGGDARPFLLTRLAREISDAGWAEELSECLSRLIGDPDAHPVIGRLWVMEAARGPGGEAESRLPELLKQGEIGREALWGLTDLLGEPESADRLKRLIQSHGDELRATDRGWSKAARSLARAGCPEMAAAWVNDWQDRKPAEASMLLPVAEALRSVGRYVEADTVGRAALALPEDSSTPVHGVWVALEAAIRADLAEARSRLRCVEPYRLDDSDRVAYALAESLLMVQQAGTTDRAMAFADAVDHIRVAVRSVPGRRVGAGVIDAYRRAVGRLALSAGGVRARWWQLCQRMRPPLRSVRGR